MKTRVQTTETTLKSASVRLLAVCLVVGSLALGCTSADSGPMTAEDEQALADTIASVHQEFTTRFSKLEPAVYLQHVGDDIQFYVHGWVEGASYEQALREFMAGYRSYSMEITDASIEVLGPDAGAVTGTYRIQNVDTAGQSQEYEIAFTKIYERREGSWKLVRGHESDLPEQDSQ